MPSIWRSYVPYYVAFDLALHPHASPVGRTQRFEAVALFADVSGFTVISEALGAVGKNGTEELTAILNSYFGPMIDLIYTYGGIIGKFGGDAMTVLFPYTDVSYPDVAGGAVQCALDMQAKMTDYAAISTRAGSFNLAMKAGLAAGPLFCTSVGDPEVRLEYLITGSVLDRCADAEHHAMKGEVVIHKELMTAVAKMAVAKERDEFILIEELKTRLPANPLTPLADLKPETIRTIAAYMHPSIAQRLRDEQASFINEHRKVTVLFISFGSFDYDTDPEVGHKLQNYLAQVIQIVHRYDGFLNKVDMGDKGSKYIVLFGAPIAHEDDEERALRCGLDLRDLPDTAVRMGVNTGFVYCGQVGSEVRQEYTVMGDAVNLAARLMQAAESGQILVSSHTFAAVADAFAWAHEASIHVKGKTATIGIHTLLRLKRRVSLQLQEPQYTLPMVGREVEFQATQERLTRVLQGQGQIVGITAEAGMGKSRLAAELIKLAAKQGLAGYGGECLSHGVNTSYLVWQNLLRGFFGLNPTWSLETQMRHLEAQLTRVDMNLGQRMPLLARALNLPIPENELTRAMDAKLRKDSLEALLVDCIRHRALESPLLLVLEDCHWIDSLSNDLLEAVGRNMADVPVLMLVIYRPPETEYIQPQVSRFGHFSEIRLAEFTSQEAEQLIGLKLTNFFGALSDIPAQFMERIIERAQGNPFYIDEMINLIRDRGIAPADTQALQSLDLPDSLHSLIISRLDQLAEGPKTTLKVASVIGRLFKADWLWAIYPQLGVPERVKVQLAMLSQLDITPLDKSEPDDLEYLFKHIVTREVAYESLAVATRTMLHEQIGLFIERTYPDNLEQFVDLLAYHYGFSQNMAKQREYLQKAGAVAQSTYANEAAIDYYQRLLPLLPEDERSRIMLELGQVWQLIGNWAEAEETYRTALKIAEQTNTLHIQAQSERAIGTLLRFKGAYAESFVWLERAQRRFEVVDDQHGLSDTLGEIGIVFWGQGDYVRALDYYEHCLQIASTLDDRRSIYRAMGNMGGIYWIQGQYSQALDYFERCQQISDGLGDQLGVAVAMGNKGNVYLDQGDYTHALASHAQYLHIALELGYRQGVSIAVGNMGEVYEKQGDYGPALACYSYNLRTALEIGDRMGVGFATWSMAKVYIWQARYEEADRLLTQVVALGQALDIPYELCEYLYTQARVSVRQGEYGASQRFNDEALRMAMEVEHRGVQFEAQVLSMRLRAAMGQIVLPEAVGELKYLLDEWTAETEQAAVQYEIWRLDPNQETVRQYAADQYLALYMQTPNIKYKYRYERLTDDQLPDPPALPPLPEIVTRRTADLDTLLTQVDALIGELNAS